MDANKKKELLSVILSGIIYLSIDGSSIITLKHAVHNHFFIY
mgnify:CR=1 FL=1